MPLKYKHTIMIVDDEASILNAIQRLFRKDGHQIITAGNGTAGLDLLKNAERPVSLIISDQRMPEMSGSQFLKEAKEIFPDAIRFLLTGYSDMDAIVDAINQGEIHRYLTKPWNDDDLRLQVRHSLEQRELVLENKRLLALTHRQNKELRQLNEQLEEKVQERSREIIAKNKKLSQLNKELESNLFNTVRAFVSLTEMQSPALAGHGRRVSHLAREIAQLLDLPEDEVVHVEIAALLHDVGKIGLPQTLVDCGVSKRTADEEALIQRHPEEGQNIVRFIKNLDPVGHMIRSHHERYDGRGYPDQLSEEEIPLGSRIIAVADGYDGIVNLRVDVKSHIEAFQKERETAPDPLSEEEMLQQAAIHHLRQSGFTWYDPVIVKVFLEYAKGRRPASQKEKKVTLDELEAGMVLIRSLYTEKGRFLLPYDTVLTEKHVERLRIIHKNDPMPGQIHILENGG